MYFVYKLFKLNISTLLQVYADISLDGWFSSGFLFSANYIFLTSKIQLEFRYYIIKINVDFSFMSIHERVNILWDVIVTGKVLLLLFT